MYQFIRLLSQAPSAPDVIRFLKSRSNLLAPAPGNCFRERLLKSRAVEVKCIIHLRSINYRSVRDSGQLIQSLGKPATRTCGIRGESQTGTCTVSRLIGA
jgi:hypothetical protein